MKKLTLQITSILLCGFLSFFMFPITAYAATEIEVNSSYLTPGSTRNGVYCDTDGRLHILGSSSEYTYKIYLDANVYEVGANAYVESVELGYGKELDYNYGHITNLKSAELLNNYGIIEFFEADGSRWTHIENNYGTIKTSHSLLTNNYGLIEEIIRGDIINNAFGGVIITNNCNVITNNGRIEENKGAVTTNSSSGVIAKNSVSGIVGTNYGHVYQNENPAYADLPGFTSDPEPEPVPELVIEHIDPESIRYIKVLEDKMNEIKDVAKKLESGELKGPQTISYEADNVPMSMLTLLENYPDITLEYTTIYDNKNYRFLIPGGKKSPLDPSFSHHGPLGLNVYYRNLAE